MNRALPEMLHCLNSPGNLAGNCTDMTLLERQRARLKWQQEQLHHQQQQQSSYFSGSELSGVFFQAHEDQVQSFQAGLVGAPALARPVKPDPGLENGWPELDKMEIPGMGFGSSSSSCGLVNGTITNTSTPGFQMNGAISRTYSCPPKVVAAVATPELKAREAVLPAEKLSSGAGRESFKKRKSSSDKLQNSKVRNKYIYIYISGTELVGMCL